MFDCSLLKKEDDQDFEEDDLIEHDQIEMNMNLNNMIINDNKLFAFNDYSKWMNPLVNYNNFLLKQRMMIRYKIPYLNALRRCIGNSKRLLSLI